VALSAEAEGFEHLHFHVIPRSPGLDPAYRSPRMSGLPGGDPARHVPDKTTDQIAADLTRALAARS
jgi:diadenosine tetraphosphate (Ap4A) HIT family hydrolase